jgi:EAL domain-containing protein (putative c-di-GMP-specific phosphodiesterase class I)
VKIDRSFITDLDREPTAAVIVGAIVGLAHGLGMTVIAEGIETPDHLHRIAELGCDAYQGFHFARPASSAAFGLMVAENECATSRELVSIHAGRGHPTRERVAR